MQRATLVSRVERMVLPVTAMALTVMLRLLEMDGGVGVDVMRDAMALREVVGYLTRLGGGQEEITV